MLLGMVVQRAIVEGQGKIGLEGPNERVGADVKAANSIPLDIEDVSVLTVEVSQNGDIHIRLESSLNYGYCRSCGHKLTKLHGYDDWVKVQHIPILGHAVFLHYRPKRYKCIECDRKPTPDLSNEPFFF